MPQSSDENKCQVWLSSRHFTGGLDTTDATTSAEHAFLHELAEGTTEHALYSWLKSKQRRMASPGAMVIFGGGYGIERLADIGWLKTCDIIYWGDIDTHGFAILNQLRAHLPQAKSFLMDSETLLAHRPLWGDEPTPELKSLQRLTTEERALFDDLRDNRLGLRVRLEQERIGFEWLTTRLAAMP